VARNGSIVLSADSDRDFVVKEKRSTRLSQAALIEKLDKWADELARGAGNLDCLRMNNVPIPQEIQADFLETVGSYFETKGKNFGLAAGARTQPFEDQGAGPIQSAEDRIEALCYAKIMYKRARDSVKKIPAEPPTEDAGLDTPTEFESMLKYYDKVNFEQRLEDKNTSLSAFLTDKYSQGQSERNCPKSYPKPKSDPKKASASP
jgi:hypothetical protein